MLKKWITALLGLLTVMLVLVAFDSSIKADEIPTAGLTGTDAVVTDYFGNVITNTSTMNKWQDYTVSYKWSIRDGQPIKAGDTAMVELPNGAIADKDLSFPLKDSVGRVIGNFSIKAGDTTGAITFNDALGNVGTNREGTLEFFAKGTQNNDQHYGWVINKIGWVSGYDETGLPSELTWNVAFNPEELDIGHVVVTDTLGQNQTYVPGSVYAETGSYNSAGEFIANGTVTPTVSQTGNVISFTFEGIKSAVNMVYRAKLSHVTSDQTKWENIATMNGTTVNSSVAWGGSGTGKLTIRDLTPGTYSFVETTPPTGYLLSHTPIVFTIEANATATSVEVTQVDIPIEETEVPQTGDVTLTKTDAKTKTVLAGAVYELRDSSGKVIRSGLETDAQGQLTVNDLPADKYSLVEVKAPAGYELNPTPVNFVIESNSTTHQVINVSQADEPSDVPPTLGSMQFTKRNSETLDPVAGAVYRLTNSDGVVVADNLISDAAGHFTVKDLPTGNYQLTEIKAPAGYELNTRPVSFQITADNLTTVVQTGQDDRPIPEIPGMGDVTLVKTDTSKHHLLAGAVYELQTGTGQVLQSGLTTSSQGQIRVTKLLPGEYQFVETQAPEGYQLNRQPLKFTITAGQTAAVEVAATDEANTPEEPGTPVKPEQPGVTPGNPGGEPGQPGVTPENPGAGSSQPTLPQTPDFSGTPEQPGTFEVVPGAPSTGTLVNNGTSAETGSGQPSGLPQTNDHSSLGAVIAGLIGLLTGIFGWAYLDRRRA